MNISKKFLFWSLKGAFIRTLGNFFICPSIVVSENFQSDQAQVSLEVGAVKARCLSSFHKDLGPRVGGDCSETRWPVCVWAWLLPLQEHGQVPGRGSEPLCQGRSQAQHQPSHRRLLQRGPPLQQCWCGQVPVFNGNRSLYSGKSNMFWNSLYLWNI